MSRERVPAVADTDTTASLTVHAWLAGIKPRQQRLSAGEVLFRQSQRAAGVFLLVTGAVRLQRATPDGTEVAMHTARGGETFAEASLFGERYHCDAVALQDSVVLLYPRHALRERLRAQPQAAWAFSAALAHQVQGLRTRLELRQTRSARERLWQYLRLHADIRGCWSPPGTLKALAADLGMTHEALYRALAALTRAGRIRRAGGVIVLTTPATPQRPACPSA